MVLPDYRAGPGPPPGGPSAGPATGQRFHGGCVFRLRSGLLFSSEALIAPPNRAAPACVPKAWRRRASRARETRRVGRTHGSFSGGCATRRAWARASASVIPVRARKSMTRVRCGSRRTPEQSRRPKASAPSLAGRDRERLLTASERVEVEEGVGIGLPPPEGRFGFRRAAGTGEDHDRGERDRSGAFGRFATATASGMRPRRSSASAFDWELLELGCTRNAPSITVSASAACPASSKARA